jgi:NADH dehydrogenase
MILLDQARTHHFMNNNILILGGTGFVGRSVCDKLVERNGGGGAQIVVPSRQPARAKHLQLLPTVRLVQADVHNDAQLAALVRGCDAVINLVAILHGSESEFRRAHVELPLKLSRVCVAAGVRRVVHVSALGVAPLSPSPASSPASTAQAATGLDAPSIYLRSKTSGEALLSGAGLDLTILRPSVIFGEHDRFLNLFARLQTVFPMMPLAGADARFQPVWVQDVAAAIVRCLDDDATIGKVYECAGPQVYTLRQLVQTAGRLSGHARPVISLPTVLGQLQALAMEMLPGSPLMSRDNLASMRVPNVQSGKLPGLRELGITPATLDSVAPDYLSPGRGLARLDRWRAGEEH